MYIASAPNTESVDMLKEKMVVTVSSGHLCVDAEWPAPYARTAGLRIGDVKYAKYFLCGLGPTGRDYPTLNAAASELHRSQPGGKFVASSRQEAYDANLEV